MLVYLKTLNKEVLNYPLYSPDIVPADDHLFQSMTQPV